MAYSFVLHGQRRRVTEVNAAGVFALPSLHPPLLHHGTHLTPTCTGRQPAGPDRTADLCSTVLVRRSNGSNMAIRPPIGEWPTIEDILAGGPGNGGRQRRPSGPFLDLETASPRGRMAAAGDSAPPPERPPGCSLKIDSLSSVGGACLHARGPVCPISPDQPSLSKTAHHSTNMNDLCEKPTLTDGVLCEILCRRNSLQQKGLTQTRIAVTFCAP